MAQLSKRMRAGREAIDKSKSYSIDEALSILAGLQKVKFIESVDISVNLGVDPRKSDQIVRGAAVLPHGTGKTARVAVFAQGANADKAKEAGADIVGFEELGADIEKGNMDFDILIATPDSMRVVGKLGPILGPRGLMPNPKVGTVTPDVAQAVKNAKAGQVQYRTDKNGIIHCSIGKINFELDKLKENIAFILAELKKLKPTAAKGVYMKKLTVSTTMGPGIVVDMASLAL